jgi:hypothetical protein
MHGVRKKKPERPGFEPGVEFYPYNCLAGSCLQPLGHLSLISKNIDSKARLLIPPTAGLQPLGHLSLISKNIDSKARLLIPPTAGLQPLGHLS